MRTPRFVAAAVLALSTSLLGGCHAAPTQRYAMVVGLKPDKIQQYKNLHAHAWPGVLAAIDRSHIRNYSIWLTELKPHEYYLFGYFEYDGPDFAKDMARMGDDATTRRWWKVTASYQQPIFSAGKDEQWVMMHEVFYHDRAHPDATLMPAPKPISAGKSPDGTTK